MRYKPGYTGPTLPGPTKNPNDPRLGSPRPAVVSTKPPAPAPSGPLVPVRGGGMAPQSQAYTMKKGGKVKCMAKGGSASKRADGIAKQGKTKGKIC